MTLHFMKLLATVVLCLDSFFSVSPCRLCFGFFPNRCACV
jgi:hypothetical protein